MPMLIPVPIPMPAPPPPPPPPRSMLRSFRETRPSDARARAASTVMPMPRKMVMIGGRDILNSSTRRSQNNNACTCIYCVSSYGFRCMFKGVRVYVMYLLLFNSKTLLVSKKTPKTLLLLETQQSSGIYRTQNKQGFTDSAWWLIGDLVARNLWCYDHWTAEFSEWWC